MAEREDPTEDSGRSRSIFDGSMRPIAAEKEDDGVGNGPEGGPRWMLPAGAFVVLALVLVIAMVLGGGGHSPDVADADAPDVQPTVPAQGSGDADATPEAWHYDEANDRHWHPDHGHWHDGPPPTDAGKTPIATPPIPPGFAVDMDAPTVEQAHPGLATGGLAFARLMELPEGFLLLSPSFGIGEDEIAAQIAEAPRDLRAELRKNAFIILEQRATESLLVEEALNAAGEPGMDEHAAIRAYFRRLTDDIEVADAEVEQFYHENREMLGGASLDTIRPRIEQHLVQQKQEEALRQHIRTLTERTPVAVSASWAAQQARLAKDNVVDRARASGKPTFASFGADTCQPCVAMEPVREAARKKFAGKANVVYVHVGKEQMLASRYGVQGIPMLLFFDAEGKEAHRHTGMMPQEEVERRLEGLIGGEGEG